MQFRRKHRTILRARYARLILCGATVAASMGMVRAETPEKEPTPREKKQEQATKPASANKRPSVEERLDILEEEVENQKVKKATRTYKSELGMGPAASAVYQVEEGISYGGYAELNGSGYKSRYRPGVADVGRLVFYSGYRFSENILFNAEVELEHAGFERHDDAVTGVDFGSRTTKQSVIQGGSASAEFAYVEFRLADWLQLRPGLNLVPIGITNWMHEPNTFYSVHRPTVETLIIPTTWRELGLLATGQIGDRFQYRTGVMTGLDATKFTSSEWIGEDGSYRGSEALVKGGAFIFNADYKPIDALTLGASYYAGSAGQGNIQKVTTGERLISPDYASLGLSAADAAQVQTIQQANRPTAPVLVQMAEAHFLFKTGPWDLRGLAVRGWMNEADTRAVNRATGENVGMVAEGAYLEAAFNLLSFTRMDQRLMLFVRGEYVNTQRKTTERKAGGRDDVLDALCNGSSICKTTGMMTNGNQDLGFIAAEDPLKEAYGTNGLPDRTNDRRIATIGLAYFPHPNVTVKAEYQRNTSLSNYYGDAEYFNAENNKIDQINVGVGLVF